MNIEEMVFDIIQEFLEKHKDTFDYDCQCGSMFIDDKQNNKTYSVSVIECTE